MSLMKLVKWFGVIQAFLYWSYVFGLHYLFDISDETAMGIATFFMAVSCWAYIAEIDAKIGGTND